jgi:hypothetical protein
MISFTTTILKFGKQGEKTGWTYIEIPQDLADKLKPGFKKSYRVKGTLDKLEIKGISLLPMGGGSFILVLNAATRKALAKKQGAMLKVKIEEDKAPFRMNRDFMTCLNDEPAAKKFFSSLPGSHQRYFSKWMDDAKTIETRAARIARAVNALARNMGFAQMLREKKI